MKILVFSDVHMDAVTAGVSRFEDVRTAMLEVARRAIALEARCEDVKVVFGGDLCDPDSSNMIRCIKAARQIFFDLEFRKIESYWMTGNHDVLEDGHGTSVLDLVVSGPGLINTPRVVGNIGFLPYAALSGSYDPESIVRSWSKQLLHVDVIVGHLMLGGIAPGSESKDYARGRDLFFPIDEALRCFPKAILINGHYHDPQVYRGVHVPGGLCRFTRADAGRRAGYLEIEV